MRLSTALFGLLVVSTRLSAATIQPVPVEVTTATTQWLNPTDKLLFTVTAPNSAIQASGRGLPTYPSTVSFQLIAWPESLPGEFSAWWQSTDGSIISEFPGTFSWLPGRIQSSGYTGPVSVLYGSMPLSSTTAQELLAGRSAVLVLENLGSPVNVGLPRYTLAQDLTANFSATGLGVSGRVTGVQYLDPPPPVPEPPSGVILLVIGAALCCAGKVMSRISDRHIQ
jgi:hypothetical protein